VSVDRFGRTIDYLRLSVTDRCNLRCVYCMPLGGLPVTPGGEMLSAVEIETVVRAALGLGFRKFRLTGGEPTLREDVVEIVERLSAVEGVADLSMTTNAVRLPNLAQALARAGLRRVNLHVDSLDADHLARTMRLGTLDAIEAGLEAALAVGFSPVKLNCVVTRGRNEEDVVPLARRALRHGWHARFIELMPLGRGETVDLARTRFVPTCETRARLETAFGPLEAVSEGDPSDGARNFRVPGRNGVIGFISPVSEPYCGTCNRMRLTADGRLHLCLLRDDEIDLKPLLRGSAPAEALRAALALAVAEKPSGHRLAEDVSAREREMYQIGG
jgi:cyclic pyranopterin phosphate synthase